MENLNGKTVAILVTDGFEEEELTRPRDALHEAGAETQIVAPSSDTVRAWDHTEWGGEYAVDRSLDDADPDEYDALLLPGGVWSPDKLRMDQRAQAFVRAFFDEGKPVAAICHGPWTMIDAGVADGRRMTSYPSLRSDLVNAGADWVDEEVVEDRGLVTSRRPDDIPAFNERMVQAFVAAGA